MKLMLFLLIIITSCDDQEIIHKEESAECNLPSVFCSNGEMWNGTKCPGKSYVLDTYSCDSVKYFHR